MLQKEDNIKALQKRIALYDDMKAYKELYLLLFESLYKFSFSFVKSPEVAEEIVSDVFIKVWQMRSQLRDIHYLKVYLYQMTKNFSLSHIEKESKRQIVHLDQVADTTFVDSKTPEDLYISSELMESVGQVIGELPLQCRTIFLLVKEHGLRYKEVASILGVSVFTVRNQVAIATKKISERLPNHAQYFVYFQDKFSHS